MFARGLSLCLSHGVPGAGGAPPPPPLSGRPISAQTGAIFFSRKSGKDLDLETPEKKLGLANKQL